MKINWCICVIFILIGVSLIMTEVSSAAGLIYVVKAGDTLWSISQRHQIDLDTLVQLNGIEKTTIIYPGMELQVSATNIEIQIYIVKSGDTLYSIAKRFGLDYHELQRYNGIPDASKINVGMKLQIPLKSIFTLKQQISFAWPLHGTITSTFGVRGKSWHDGLDISAPVGTEVRAAAAGKVIKAGWISGYGNTIIIEHADGFQTLYAHNSKILVQVGEWVSVSQVIAKSGNTGRTTGPHLHLEIHKNGIAVDPLLYLQKI